MEFRFLYDRIRSLSEEDYERIGFVGNPAYHGLRCGDVESISVHVAREPLESELKSLLNAFFEGSEFKHAYLYGSEIGSGKSHTQNVLKDYCLEKNMPFVELSHDDFDDVDILDMDILRYIIDLSGSDRVVIFCCCQTEFYDKLIELKDVCIIGCGHSTSELKGIEDKFRIFDIQKDYPLTSDDIYSLLKETLKEISLKPKASVLPDPLLKSISKMTNNPGMALDALGACLAILAYKALTGQTPELTESDFRYCCDKRFIRWVTGFRKNPVSQF